MDWSYAGLPFVDVPSTTSVNTLTMDWAYAGLPFVTNPGGVTGPANVKTINGVSISNVKTLNGVELANIKSINGVF